MTVRRRRFVASHGSLRSRRHARCAERDWFVNGIPRPLLTAAEDDFQQQRVLRRFIDAGAMPLMQA
jgi:hypothetical protein